jgi:hypothetical protein
MALHGAPSTLLSLDQMREVVNERFGFTPCTWQLEAALAQLAHVTDAHLFASIHI